MVAADEFQAISTVLSELAPPEANVRAIEVRKGEGRRRIVSVHTPSPILLIGPRSATADALRAAMADRLCDGQLQLNIVETRDDLRPDDRPPEEPDAMYPPT